MVIDSSGGAMKAVSIGSNVAKVRALAHMSHVLLVPPPPPPVVGPTAIGNAALESIYQILRGSESAGRKH